jgi:hypothetical protein
LAHRQRGAPPGSNRFSKGFLIVTPGITIRDRLRVLRPEDPDSYYAARELVPPDLIADIARAKIVIRNYHAFRKRESMEVSKVGRALLQGRGEPPVTVETEGEMLERACGELLTLKNVVVINDEAHHCYRERPSREGEDTLRGEEKDEAAKNNEAARLWISGVEALEGKVGLAAVYDLSATPFFLAGSGYREGSLFPWVVSDFSLLDAIECGIVKLPRVPVDDNLPSGDMPICRNLWQVLKERGRSLPRKGASKAGDLDPLKLASELQTAHCAKTGLSRPGGQGARCARNSLSARRGLSSRAPKRAAASPFFRGLVPHPNAGERRPLHGVVAGHRGRERRDHAEGAGRDTAEQDHLPHCSAATRNTVPRPGAGTSREYVLRSPARRPPLD